jgi:dienelactone hydrolase
MPPSLRTGPIKIPSGNEQIINAEVKGSGETAIVFANMSDNYSGVWLKLINALDKNNFTMVNFTYTAPEPDTARAEMDAVLKYLEEHGVKRFVCVGASLGTMACTHAAQHPGMAGLVFMAGPRSDSLAEAKYPKLFIVADKDGSFPESTQAMYAQAADPKTLEVVPGYAHGAALFLDGSLDVAATIADFLNNLP